MEANSKLSLGDALESLHEQLMEAVHRTRGRELQLFIQEIEVELQLLVSTTRHSDGKIGLWSVVTAEAGIDQLSSSTHRVKLKVLPELNGEHIRYSEISP